GGIECVGCDCADEAPAASVTVSCPEGVVSPGLVNAHAHIRYAFRRPIPVPGTERYDHRPDWRTGARGHTSLGTFATDTRASVLWGELRMMFSGVTSIAGSISGVDASGLVRNLDSTTYNEGLGSWRANYS